MAEPTQNDTDSRRRSGLQIARDAMEQLEGLTGKETEGVVGLERNEHGWLVSVEVLELERVPRTTDVLATYEVELDGRGDLVGYRRLRRYMRGATDEE